jgi:hypothetical protein
LLDRLDLEFFGNAGSSWHLLVGLIMRLGGGYEIGAIQGIEVDAFEMAEQTEV